MNPNLAASCMVCCLSSVVFALASKSPLRLGVCVLGFVTTVFFTLRGGLPEANTFAAVAASVALTDLIAPRLRLFTALGCGVCSAYVGSVLNAEGLHLAGFGVSILPPLAAFLLSTNPNFAPKPMRDEARLGVFFLALIVSIGSPLADGWRSALALNVQGQNGAMSVLPIWVLILGGISIALGGCYSLWRRN